MVTHDNLGIHRFNIDAKSNLINLVTILLEILRGVKKLQFFLTQKKVYNCNELSSLCSSILACLHLIHQGYIFSRK